MSMSSLSAVMASPRFAPTRVAFGNGDHEKRLPQAELDSDYPTQGPVVPPAPKSHGVGRYILAALIAAPVLFGGAAWKKWENLNTTIAQLQERQNAQAQKHQADIIFTAQMASECTQKSPECPRLLELALKDPDLKDIATKIKEKTQAK